jgi:hypothetical protein
MLNFYVSNRIHYKLIIICVHKLVTLYSHLKSVYFKQYTKHVRTNVRMSLGRHYVIVDSKQK